MGALEKQQGHAAEKSASLHKKLMSYSQIGHGEVLLEGRSDTKTDFMIGSKRISQKTPTGKNTQVWLPTKKTLFEHIPGLSVVKCQLLQFLGSPNQERKAPSSIDNFSEVIDTFNQETKHGNLLKKIFLQVNDEPCVDFISWVGKSKSGVGLTLIDANLYVEELKRSAVWVPRPTTLWLIHKDDINLPANKVRKYLHLQRKGSPSKNKHIDGEYYSPMFHLYNTWPDTTIVARDPLFKIDGI